MSWHHAAHHKTKQAAKAHAEKHLAYTPEHVKTAVLAALDALPDAEGAISVDTHGHIEAPFEMDGKTYGHSKVHIVLEHKPFPHD